MLTPPGAARWRWSRPRAHAALAAVDAHFHAANGRPIRRAAERTASCSATGASGAHREEVIVIRGAGDSVEIHCHGGVAASERILAALAAAGCAVESWQEWTRRHGRRRRLQAEADERAGRRHDATDGGDLLDQRSGALRAAVERDRSETRATVELESARTQTRCAA